MIPDRLTSFRTLIPPLIAPAVLVIGFAFAPLAAAQETEAGPIAHPPSSKSAKAEQGSIPALLVSDIHFDPFHDPAKAKELVAAPVDRWRSILSAPSSGNQQQRFAALQQSCHARGVDTPLLCFDQVFRLCGPANRTQDS